MDMRSMIIEQHYKKQSTNLMRRATRRLRGDMHLAQEAVQETYAKALKNFNTFDMEKSNFNTWIKHILNNTVKDIMSQEALRGGNKKLDEHEDIPSTEPSADHSLSNKELLEKIAVDISEVKNPLQRQVLYLYFIKGLYPVDICKTVKRISPENAAQIASRFKQELHLKYGEAV